MPNATCTVDGCNKKPHCRGLCPMHYQRRRIRGDVGIPGYERQPNVGACSVEGCEQPQRKRTWCASHYAQWKRMGEVKSFAYKWADEANCIVCGKPNGQFRSRKVCSDACKQMWWRDKQPRVREVQCVLCGCTIDLTAVGKGGRRRYRSVRLCRRCKQQTRTEATPGQLALRDGPFCQLCGCDVDLLGVFPDPMRPSVDHILPRAWGGGDEAENNQLTHLHCNHVKSDRHENRSSRSP